METLNKMDLELGFWWEEENEIAKSTSESGIKYLKLGALIWENTKYFLQNMTCQGYIRGKQSRRRSPEIVLVFQTKLVIRTHWFPRTLLQYHYLMSHFAYRFWVVKTWPVCLMGSIAWLSNKNTHLFILERISCSGHLKSESAVLWVHWCDPGLRGWSVGWSPQNHPGWL